MIDLRRTLDYNEENSRDQKFINEIAVIGKKLLKKLNLSNKE